MLGKGDSIYLYIIYLSPELNAPSFFPSDDGPKVMFTHAHYPAVYLISSEKKLFLFQHFFDYAQIAAVIIRILQLGFVVLLQPMRLGKNLSLQMEQSSFQHPALRSLAFALFAVGPISTAYIIVFASGATDTQTPALSADMPIQPFDTFPQQFHIRGEVHVAFITGRIRHANLFVLKIGL